MKKYSFTKLILVFAFVISCFSTCVFSVEPAQADKCVELFKDSPVAYVNGVRMQIDGENEKVVPFIANNRTMIPVRFIAQNIDLKVDWNAAERLVTLTGTVSDINVRLTVGSQIAVVNGKDVELDSQAVIKNDRVFVPLRFVTENFGYAVEWDEYRQRVIIKEEHELDVNNPEVKALFEDVLNCEEFASYYDQRIDIDIMDHRYNIINGIMREVISILYLGDLQEREYTNEESHDVVGEFLAKAGTIEKTNQYGIDDLKSDFDLGKHYGETLVGTLPKSKFDEVSKNLFGSPLVADGDVAYSVGYANVFFFSRVNMSVKLSPALGYAAYYSAAGEEYLFTKEIYIDMEAAKEYLDSLKFDTRLLRAKRHNDEISLYIYHETEFQEYSGADGFYSGEFKNTYKQNGEDFYWVNSCGKTADVQLAREPLQ